MQDVPPQAVPSQDIAAVRSFNRFYTRRIGVVTERVLGAPVGLPEARLLLELSAERELFAGDLAQSLGMDGGQVSRVVKKLEQRDLLRREVSASDGRRRRLLLTDAGRELLAELHDRADGKVREMLGELGSEERRRFVAALKTIEQILEPSAEAPCVLRGLGPGDWGWVISRHGELYAEAFGFNHEFEAIVAEVVLEFMRDHDPGSERFWIADVDGRRAGCIALCREDEATARLRLFLVEPWARGRGVGKALADECLRFAKSCGYAKVVLWTQEAFAPARGIYRKRGFELKKSVAAVRWGRSVVDETWELELAPPVPTAT